jgi:chromatin remodeling complex protein RSC6
LVAQKQEKHVLWYVGYNHDTRNQALTLRIHYRFHAKHAHLISLSPRLAAILSILMQDWTFKIWSYLHKYNKERVLWYVIYNHDTRNHALTLKIHYRFCAQHAHSISLPSIPATNLPILMQDLDFKI